MRIKEYQVETTSVGTKVHIVWFENGDAILVSEFSGDVYLHHRRGNNTRLWNKTDEIRNRGAKAVVMRFAKKYQLGQLQHRRIKSHNRETYAFI
jgi:hypothetical protein